MKIYSEIREREIVAFVDIAKISRREIFPVYSIAELQPICFYTYFQP